MDTFTSDLSKKEFPVKDKVSAAIIRKPILELINKDYPEFNSNHCCSISELNFYREKYLSDFITKELGELKSLKEIVIDSLKKETAISGKIETEEPDHLTPGQKLADRVASFGGSWTFIILFGAFIFIWIALNVIWFTNKNFDPYPFILLNLILSCLAALQAPVIMMSQNRQEEKDRERAKKDYLVNLKSEMEIRLLHEKIDHLIMHQQQELIEIQKIQVDMMNDILNKIK